MENKNVIAHVYILCGHCHQNIQMIFAESNFVSYSNIAVGSYGNFCLPKEFDDQMTFDDLMAFSQDYILKNDKMEYELNIQMFC